LKRGFPRFKNRSPASWDDRSGAAVRAKRKGAEAPREFRRIAAGYSAAAFSPPLAVAALAARSRARFRRMATADFFVLKGPPVRALSPGSAGAAIARLGEPAWVRG
jgi:hypothetical protein